MTTQRGSAGQILGAMFSGRGSSLGVRMTKQIKKIGCSNLKTLIESDKLLVMTLTLLRRCLPLSEEVHHGRQKKVVMMTYYVS